MIKSDKDFVASVRAHLVEHSDCDTGDCAFKDEIAVDLEELDQSEADEADRKETNVE